MLQTNLLANKPSLKEVCICCYVWAVMYEMNIIVPLKCIIIIYDKKWKCTNTSWLFGDKTISALIDYLFLRVKNACFDSDCLPFSTIDHDILG